jgi:hypothetical protein
VWNQKNISTLVTLTKFDDFSIIFYQISDFNDSSPIFFKFNDFSSIRGNSALWSCFREILAASSEIGGRINQSEGRMTIFCHLICLSKFQQARWRMSKGYLGVMGKHRKMLDLHTGNHDAQTRKAPWSFFIWKTFGELWKIVVF